jgi:hypothetical protein
VLVVLSNNASDQRTYGYLDGHFPESIQEK